MSDDHQQIHADPEQQHQQQYDNMDDDIGPVATPSRVAPLQDALDSAIQESAALLQRLRDASRADEDERERNSVLAQTLAASLDMTSNELAESKKREAEAQAAVELQTHQIESLIEAQRNLLTELEEEQDRAEGLVLDKMALLDWADTAKLMMNQMTESLSMDDDEEDLPTAVIAEREQQRADLNKRFEKASKALSVVVKRGVPRFIGSPKDYAERKKEGKKGTGGGGGGFFNWFSGGGAGSSGNSGGGAGSSGNSGVVGSSSASTSSSMMPRGDYSGSGFFAGGGGGGGPGAAAAGVKSSSTAGGGGGGDVASAAPLRGPGAKPGPSSSSAPPSSSSRWDWSTVKNAHSNLALFTSLFSRGKKGAPVQGGSAEEQQHDSPSSLAEETRADCVASSAPRSYGQEFWQEEWQEETFDSSSSDDDDDGECLEEAVSSYSSSRRKRAMLGDGEEEGGVDGGGDDAADGGEEEKKSRPKKRNLATEIKDKLAQAQVRSRESTRSVANLTKQNAEQAAEISQLKLDKVGLAHRAHVLSEAMDDMKSRVKVAAARVLKFAKERDDAKASATATLQSLRQSDALCQQLQATLNSRTGELLRARRQLRLIQDAINDE